MNQIDITIEREVRLMLVPDQVRVDQIEGLAKEVMQVSRDTLAVKLRFLNPALSRLELLPSTWPLATDGVRLLYDPVYVLHAYAKERNMPVLTVESKGRANS